MVQAGVYSGELEREAVKTVADAVVQWQLTHESGHRDTDWTEAAYYTGVTWWMQESGSAFLPYWLRERAAGMEWQLGPRLRHADDHCVGYAYTQLYALDQDPRIIAPMRRSFDQWMEAWDAEADDRVGQPGKLEYWWCDALFMSPPVLAELTRVTGDPRYAAFMDKLYQRCIDYLYDPDEHLFYRDDRFKERREPNGAKVFWSRGDGWVFAGLPRLLESLPAAHPTRERYQTLFLDMAAALKACQKPDGYWASSLLYAEGQPHPETSGTAFFTYGMAWGINQGLLPAAEYRPAVELGWKALVAAVLPNGKLGWVQRIGDQPESTGSEETEVYAVGGFLLAASQVHQMSVLDGSTSAEVTCTQPEDGRTLLDAVVSVPWAEAAARLPGIRPDRVAVRDGLAGRFVPVQVLDADGDGVPEELLFAVRLLPGETRPYRIVKLAGAPPPTPPHRLAVRHVPERKDDFAFENDRIAYRFYGPALAVEGNGGGADVWGKSTRDPVMDEMYLRADYHEDHGKGGDFYSVGPTTGAGGLAYLAPDGTLVVSPVYQQWRILANGPLRLVFELSYEPIAVGDARIGEVRRIALDAGQHFFRAHSRFEVTGNASGIVPVAGFPDHEGASILRREPGLLSVWEPTAPEDDDAHYGLALASSVPDADVQAVAGHHVLAVGTLEGDASWSAGSAWSGGLDAKEPDGWGDIVDAWRQGEASPIRVSWQ
jgi:rhamnogalacturonyl hydrolase YesR